MTVQEISIDDIFIDSFLIPESCEIDDWVISHIDFITFELDALRDKVRRMY